MYNYGYGKPRYLFVFALVMVFASASASGPRQRTYEGAYRSILSARRRSPSASAASVVLLVSPELDALCAARMFSSLFKQDDVPYRIIPVSGYAGLEEIRDELKQHAEVCLHDAHNPFKKL